MVDKIKDLWHNKNGDVMKTKFCKNPNCKNINPQPIENFHRDKNTKDGYKTRCKTCLLEKAKKYREKNRKLLAEKQKEYYKLHGDIQRQASKNWKNNNKIHVKEYFKDWYESNKIYRSNYCKEYNKKNEDYTKERYRKKRSLKFGFENTFKESEFRDKLEKQNFKCFYCGKNISYDSSTRDHYIPLSLGGSDEINNIVACCSSCNSKKRNMMPKDYIKKIDNTEPSRTNSEKSSAKGATHRI